MRSGVTLPVPSTLVVNEFVTAHVAELETSLVEPFEKVRMAESFFGALPIKTLLFVGVIASDFGVGGPTVSCAVPETVPSIAVTVTVPCSSVVTRPDWLAVASMLFDVIQLSPISVAVLPSE